ncbi:MAG: chromate transporter [Alphaproteobacteria bacterium]|nr:chromate transporter [Alphaproteobacteria bacterium]
MIYVLLFFEFFKIGLFAVGGGLVTLPFLFDLSEKYGWFSATELADMIAVSESTPGPIGINMATFAGFNTAGVAGGLSATLGLVLPSIVIIILVARMLDKYRFNIRVQNILEGLRPAVLALILYAGLQIAKITVTDNLRILTFVAFLSMMRLWKGSPIFYLFLAVGLGIALQL